jgi:hypothetical protein
MKTLFTFSLWAVFAIGLHAQFSLPVDFEVPEEDTVWNQFANAGDDPANFMLVENPDNTGINDSENCIWFNVLANADPWVGAWSDAYGPLEITADNYMMEMYVHKDVLSNCGLKLEAGTGDNVEVKVPNTLVGEWEVITFDMSAAIGNSYNRLVFFPDFPDARESASVCYVDKIGFASGTGLRESQFHALSLYPNPVINQLTLSGPEMEQLHISNVLGQRIMSLELNGEQSRVLDVEDLAPGIYFISLETAGGTLTTKFLKD